MPCKIEHLYNRAGEILFLSKSILVLVMRLGIFLAALQLNFRSVVSISSEFQVREASSLKNV